jgi:hypothetical protein
MLIGRVLTVLTLVAVLISGLPSSADDYAASRATLKGLTGVRVVVEEFDEVRKKAGFDSHTFQQTNVETELRRAGIKVLSGEEVREAPGNAFFVVRVSALHERPNAIAPYLIATELRQLVLLARNPSLPPRHVATWGTKKFGVAGVPFIRKGVRDETDKFINAWLSVNPKKGPESTE